ncbi:lysophospholipid acyltransferase family protein [Mycobacterium sp. CVI_P3]|uniref:Lysophospholipid acyltransferase family protein n=2 Tax=Mycobacterium pinniadriaticum TaxID=2994102 RepID=A0ABT3SG15_9MYCO|nr:lysophospholipid acyltransferase family protein [Mycobacterium pinniadriaticum]MCX2932026.1 lysophospholipid acyltransferase family protein [Mycobacterium pinniadriaticum]MCX2938450.1 lysophospholipid acyltransferase family protein [Mycobacterium pinniadriaticum]
MMQRMVSLARPVCKIWFRSQVRGLETFPSGAALIVSNHSGLPYAWDAPVLWVDFFEKFGYERRLYVLGHDVLFRGPATGTLMRMGMLRASRDNAGKALRSGAAVMVFPGAAHDAARPTWEQSTIDFAGHTGYVTIALEAGVPIVPVVSIGGQETQLYLTRGTWLAKSLGLQRLIRLEQMPVSFGFPFGLSVGTVNLPFPSKIITQMLAPIDITARFGKEPDVTDVDTYVRTVMQSALDGLAARRRFPILG